MCLNSLSSEFLYDIMKSEFIEMAYEYSVNTVKNDKTARTCLFSCHALATVVNLFVSTFLVAYIYSFQGGIFNYIYNVAFFNFIAYIVFFAVVAIVSRFVEKTNRIWFYRVGLLLRTGLVILVLFFGKELAQLLAVAGVLNGLSEGFYYASYNVLKQEMVSRKSMRNYAVFNQAVCKVVEIVCPVILGALIEVTTYSQVAIIVLVVCLAQLCLSIGVKSQRPAGSHFSFMEYFKKLKSNKIVHTKMKILYVCALLVGAVTVPPICFNIFVMLEFGSNLSLGTLTSIFSVITVLAIILLNRFTKAGKRATLLSILGVIPLASSVALMFSVNIYTILFYNFANAVSIMIYKTVYDIYRNGILKEAGFYGEICEHQAIVEMCMNASRIISFGAMLLISLTQSFVLFNIFMIAMALMFVAEIVLLVIYEERYCKNENMTDEEREEKNFRKIMKIVLTK